jgi:diguanylate cyclase (GGDEF)-like protein
MKTTEAEISKPLSEDRAAQPSLTEVLVQSEHVENLVKESAEELSSVNAGIKEEIANQASPQGLENALEKSEAVEGKVQDASDKLSAVNLALKDEIDERHVLEGKLATVTEQGIVDRRAALHDLLTDLPNRALLYNRLEHAFLQAQRHGWRLAVMFVDLDDFKTINDTSGHEAGDSVLRVIAQRLKDGTRGEDTVSRLGGDEFVILISGVQGETDITLIAKKILSIIEAPCEIRIGDLSTTRTIQASIGIAFFPQHGATADSLIAGADRAMYVAKRRRSGYSFAQ